MPKVTNDDIKRELKDIKDALAKSDRKFRQSLWLTPMACGIALMIAGGSALFFAAGVELPGHDWSSGCHNKSPYLQNC